jgi:hypothetical protein
MRKLAIAAAASPPPTISIQALKCFPVSLAALLDAAPQKGSCVVCANDSSKLILIAYQL